MTDHDNDPHYVYIHRDVFGAVLYVGVTHDVEQRTAQHRTSSGWRDRIHSVEVESVHPSRREGYARERQVIRELEPPENRQANPRREREGLAYSVLVHQFGLAGANSMLHGSRSSAEALVDVIYALGSECINDPTALELMGAYWRANAFAAGGDRWEFLRTPEDQASVEEWRSRGPRIADALRPITGRRRSA